MIKYDIFITHSLLFLWVVMRITVVGTKYRTYIYIYVKIEYRHTHFGFVHMRGGVWHFLIRYYLYRYTSVHVHAI